MKKRVKVHKFKRGDIIHVDDMYDISRDMELDVHFKKTPDPNLSDYGNRNFEELGEYEKCTKGFTLTIIIEEY